MKTQNVNPIASIITIGDELLIGQVVDTNSAWIARELNKAGIDVRRRVAVGDSSESIRAALTEESLNSDIIIITGGLGPTADDITKPVLCEYFGGVLTVNQQALDNVNYLFKVVFKRAVTERNLKQAEVPDNCLVIQNKRGSAPGMWFERDGKVFVSLPGVPHEMKGMLEEVVPMLNEKFKSGYIFHRTLVTFGIGESAIADLIQDYEASLPAFISLAYLPNYGQVRLRLTAKSSDRESAELGIDRKFEELKTLLAIHIISTDDLPMEAILSRLLIQNDKKIATAESCTGGYIAHLLTAKPGASEFYVGSVVSYSYKAKEDLLQVSPELLQEKGAVSEEIVRQMAEGCLQATGADYVIAVSGIMGPEGGTPQKPVGTVWIAIGDATEVKTRMLHLRFDRERNIQTTAIYALNMMREFVLAATIETSTNPLC